MTKPDPEYKHREKFEDLLRKNGLHPIDNDLKQMRVRPRDTVVGEMLRQLLCLIAELEHKSPSLKMEPTESPLTCIGAWLREHCHAAGMLIGEFLEGPAELEPELFAVLLAFSIEEGRSMPPRIFDYIADQILGYDAYLTSMKEEV